MDVTALAAAAVTLLVPYLTKLADGAIGKLGEKALDAPGKLYGWLKEKFADGQTAEAFSDWSQKPDDLDLQAAMRVQLRKALEKDDSRLLAKELATLLAHLAPATGDVIQSQSVVGDNATGIQISGKNNSVKMG